MCVYTIHTRWGSFGAGGDNYETDMYEEEQYGVRFWPLVPANIKGLNAKYEEVFIPWANLHSIVKREQKAS